MRHLIGAAVLLSLAVACVGVAHVFTPTIELPKKPTVVVLPDLGDKKQYSKFFAHLESFLTVEYVAVSKKKLVLKTYEEFHYDNVFIIGNPAVKLGADLIEFIDSGRNVFVAASGEADTADKILTDELRSAAVDCGVEFTQSGVRDNFGKVAKVIRTKNVVKSAPIVGDFAGEVEFEGNGMRVETDNPLVVPILKATKTSFVNDHALLGKIFGANIALVAAIQTRIGSRGTFLGSSKMLTDKAWGTNSVFVQRLSAWAVQQRGILRYSNIDAVKLDAEKNEVRDGGLFRVKDHIRFSITVEEFDGSKGAWVPFTPPADDPIQVEYVMLDPYVRADLTPKGRVHTADLQAPDQYGIFKFVVDYRRTGYNPLVVHEQSPLRPLKLNEYERFLVAAYPYYLSTFSAMGGFLLIGISFLYVRE